MLFCVAEQALVGCANIWDQMIGISAPEEGLEHFNLWKAWGQSTRQFPKMNLGNWIRKMNFLILEKRSLVEITKFTHL